MSHPARVEVDCPLKKSLFSVQFVRMPSMMTHKRPSSVVVHVTCGSTGDVLGLIPVALQLPRSQGVFTVQLVDSVISPTILSLSNRSWLLWKENFPLRSQNSSPEMFLQVRSCPRYLSYTPLPPSVTLHSLLWFFNSPHSICMTPLNLQLSPPVPSHLWAFLVSSV